MKTRERSPGRHKFPRRIRAEPDETSVSARDRRFPIGAEVTEGGVHFRVWAPQSRAVAVLLSPGSHALNGNATVITLNPEANGYFSALVPDAAAGMLYRYLLDSGTFPDPASRFQPEGPHGPSQIVDPSAFPWTDAGWMGVPRERRVIYELHIGTFTPEGNWRAAMERLPELAALGITIVEVMPVADFPGRFGWGYDGVNFFAPSRLYGVPDAFRAFVDRAHALGLGVILDVVYNHLGPDGNHLKAFSPDYFSRRHKTEWGEALNFDGRNSGPVREFCISNAAYWIDEFHLDGLRLDATQQIFDDSKQHIVAAIASAARKAARERTVFVVAENEEQRTQLLQSPDEGGHGLDSLWNDDFHHSAMVALTGRNEAYYSDYSGAPQELISAIKRGFLYQGQRSKWQKKRRGAPALDLHPGCFVNFIQNHDQVANTLFGERLNRLTSAGRYRAITALLLLGPATPMLFQGQEFAASAPFFYFADHTPELAEAIRQGRADFLSQFRSIACPESEPHLADPASETTFVRCKLDWLERQANADVYALHHDLLQLRRTDPVFSHPQPRGVDGAVLGTEAFVLRFFGRRQDDRLLFVNLGLTLNLRLAAEPLLAPLKGRSWKLQWSSEDPRYGGSGTPSVETKESWFIPGHAAMVLSTV